MEKPAINNVATIIDTKRQLVEFRRNLDNYKSNLKSLEKYIAIINTTDKLKSTL